MANSCNDRNRQRPPRYLLPFCQIDGQPLLLPHSFLVITIFNVRWNPERHTKYRTHRTSQRRQRRRHQQTPKQNGLIRSYPNSNFFFNLKSDFRHDLIKCISFSINSIEVLYLFKFKPEIISTIDCNSCFKTTQLPIALS